ncbi:homing endonuclease associated repeat-containing protein [Paenibacillus elgii]|uniref:homing endonuclease associated repeat-containing protein n=1 Tax=Paenibacillus elgii TaxID=189691 RepID=UPI000248CFF4|nr:hypothetical protein [Paenibacillus elgii]
MSKFHKRYTREEVIQMLQDFYKDKNINPTIQHMKNPMPSPYTLVKLFGSWENALSAAGISKQKQKETDYTKNELIYYLQKYYREFGKVPTTRDLKKNKYYPSDYPFRSHFGNFKNALIEAGLFDLRKDKNNNIFDRRPYSKDELLYILDWTIEHIGELPTNEVFNSLTFTPSTNSYIKYFGGMNNAFKIIGYSPKFIHKNKTNEQLLNDIISLSKELGRTPSADDIEKSKYCACINTYLDRFGSLYYVYDLCNLSYMMRTRYLDDKQIIQLWYDFKNKKGRIPSQEEVKYEEEHKIHSAIFYRWGNYYNFIKDIGEEINYCKYFKVYLTTKGTRCFSYSEYRITKWLEENEYMFEKEVKYKDVLLNDNTHRRFDWSIEANGQKIYVELFGLNGIEEYDLKSKIKIDDCRKNNINLIALYPNDLKRPLEEVFSFLQEDIKEVV